MVFGSQFMAIDVGRTFYVAHRVYSVATMSGQAAMSVLSHEERRRSKRLLLDVPLVIRGEATETEPFEEETFSISVSAHGALVVLASKVALGQRVFLKNPKTRGETEGRIARFGPPYGGLAQVGIEFAQPAPEFWAIGSPPTDWNLT